MILQAYVNKIPELDNIKCNKCGGDTFDMVNIIKKVPSIYSQTGKAELLPIPAFRCSECNHINEELLPKKMRAKKDEKK
jgi:uncharacterized Zn finger protein